MTLEDGSPSREQNGTFSMVDFAVPQRDKAMVHPAVDPPLCENCQKMELAFFDPNCPGCQDVLTNLNTTVPEIFAILRQWTPQTQQSLEILVREVLKRGAHVDDRDGLTDMTLLHYCCKAGANGIGDIDEACRMVNLLISKGADVYIRCRWTNMTALHYSTYFDVSPVVMILLKTTKGSDVDNPCSEFDHGTPLHIAAANLAYEAAKILIQNGADITIKDDLGRTPAECVPDPAAFDPDTDMGKLVEKMKNAFEQAETSKGGSSPRFDNLQSQVALQALGVKVGEKVVVAGVKSGILRYCGPTEFASGIWSGIELAEPAGKNDGSVGGVSYFKCSPKYGIFAPISKISKPRTSVVSSPVKVSHGRVDTSHVTARVDTGLGRKGGPEDLEIGERVLVAGQRRGVIRYCGDTDFAPGLWYGIELDRPVGKNNGTVNGREYFNCRPKYGVFAPPSRIQRLSEVHGSRDSLDSMSAAAADRQRRLSISSSGSQQSLHNSSSKKAALARTVRLSMSILENSKRCPKSSGALGLRRSFSNVGSEFKLTEGMSVFCNNELGVVRYIGPVDFAEGVWLGVELRTPKGKNDGSVQGKRYFTCKPNFGLIVRPSKVTVRGINGAKLLGDSQSSSIS